MSEPLEILIRRLAKNGRLNHVSLAFSKGQWEASYRGVDDADKKITTAKDPVEALLSALSVRPSKAPSPPQDEDDLLV